jgi:tRNA U38,U39,U40 pseudouridine synthase TruA
MVRTMVGTLLAIADNKRTEQNVLEAYQTGDRNLLGKTMSAKGLTLMQVNYNENKTE